MSDYIKREDAIKIINSGISTDTDADKRYVNGLFRAIRPADVAPIVRCKDCKHWQPSEYGVVEQPYCKHLGYKEETGLDIQIGNENDYCSFGERKDDDTD